MGKRFSIITIVKDYPDGFARTAANIRGQQGINFKEDVEWIVVNGSTDSNAVEQQMAANGALISWGQSKRDNGLYNAMNIGLEHATGEFVNFMNAGDTFATNDVLHKVSATIDRSSNCDYVYGAYLFDGAQRQPRAYQVHPYFYVSNHQSMFFKRDVIADQRYDERYKIASDFKFCEEFFTKAKEPVCVQYPIAHFEGGGIGQKRFVTVAKEMFAIRKEMHTVSMLENAVLAATYITLGKIRKHTPHLAHTIRKIGERLVFPRHPKSNSADDHTPEFM